MITSFIMRSNCERRRGWVEADKGHWHSAFQKAMNSPSRIVSLVPDIHRGARIYLHNSYTAKNRIIISIKIKYMEKSTHPLRMTGLAGVEEKQLQRL